LSDHAHAVDLGFRDRADHPRGGEMVFDGNADGNTGEQDAFLNAREIFEPRYPRTPRRAEVGDDGRGRFGQGTLTGALIGL
jgi:hypothetical protein